jgi:hypothetical protein
LNVRLVTPEQFLPSPDQPFSLPPGSSYTIRFRTALGTVERDPPTDVLPDAELLTWEQGGGVISSGARLFLLIVLGIMLVGTILAEILGESSKRDEVRSPDHSLSEGHS